MRRGAERGMRECMYVWKGPDSEQAAGGRVSEGEVGDDAEAVPRGRDGLRGKGSNKQRGVG